VHGLSLHGDRGKLVIQFRVELNFTFQDAEVRTGLAAIATAFLADVVNRGFLL
jgi:hypothetical protein